MHVKCCNNIEDGCNSSKREEALAKSLHISNFNLVQRGIYRKDQDKYHTFQDINALSLFWETLFSFSFQPQKNVPPIRYRTAMLVGAPRKCRKTETRRIKVKMGQEERKESHAVWDEQEVNSNQWMLSSRRKNKKKKKKTNKRRPQTLYRT